MTKLFTVNTPEYQRAQKKFYAYNVVNDSIDTSTIKTKEFEIILENYEKTYLSDNSILKITLTNAQRKIVEDANKFCYENQDRIISLTGTCKIFESSTDVIRADNITCSITPEHVEFTCSIPFSMNLSQSFLCLFDVGTDITMTCIDITADYLTYIVGNALSNFSIKLIVKYY